MDYPVKRALEQGHDTKCLAKALIAAVENLRDSALDHHHDFRLSVQDNVMLVWADEYLATGQTECLCDPIPLPRGYEIGENGGMVWVGGKPGDCIYCGADLDNGDVHEDYCDAPNDTAEGEVQ